MDLASEDSFYHLVPKYQLEALVTDNHGVAIGLARERLVLASPTAMRGSAQESESESILRSMEGVHSH
jgi:hypothetical protein